MDWTGSRGVHVAEETLNLPQRDSTSFVRHLKIKERYVIFSFFFYYLYFFFVSSHYCRELYDL